MHKGGHCVGPAKGLVEQHVERSTGQPLLAAYDVAHLHEVVVDNVGQVIGGQVVGLLIEHLVVENRRVDGHIATQQVVHHDIAAWLHLEAHHIVLAAVDKRFHLLGGQAQGVAHGHARRGIILEVLDLLAFLLKFLRGVEGDVGLAAVEQLLHIGVIDVAALALPVGAVVAALPHALVDAYAQPVEGLVDVVFGTGHKAVAVGILDAQYHGSAMLACKEIVVKRSAHAAYVQRACGRRCKAHSYFSFCHIL